MDFVAVFLRCIYVIYKTNQWRNQDFGMGGALVERRRESFGGGVEMRVGFEEGVSPY